jgi:hypothetical protein
LSDKGRLLAVALVFLVLAALVMQMPKVEASTASPDLGDKALSFLSDVVQLDLSKYRVTLYENSSNGDHLFYKLYSKNSVLPFIGLETLAIFDFYNGSLGSCTLSPGTVDLIYAHPAQDRFNTTLGMAQRFAAWANDSWVLGMADMMEKVGADQTAFEVSGNQSLRISLLSDGFGEYSFSNYLNGVEYTGISIDMGRPTFDVFFTDSRAFESIGNTTIGVSQEQAINIAEDYVRNYSFNETFGNGTSVQVSNLNVTGVASAELMSNVGADSMLFPYWNVRVNVSNMPSPAIEGVEVVLSANDGDIASSIQFANPNFKLPAIFTFGTESSIEFITILLCVMILIPIIAVAVILLWVNREKKPLKKEAG